MDYLLNQRFLASWSVSSQISTLHIVLDKKKWSSWVATIIKSTTKIFNYQTQAQKQAMRNHNCLFIKAKSFCLSTQFCGGELLFNPWLQIDVNDHHKYSWTVIPCVLVRMWATWLECEEKRDTLLYNEEQNTASLWLARLAKNTGRFFMCDAW